MLHMYLCIYIYILIRFVICTFVHIKSHQTPDPVSSPKLYIYMVILECFIMLSGNLVKQLEKNCPRRVS